MKTPFKTMHRIWLIALGVLLISGWQARADAQTIIAATGDSITSGYPEVWCGRGRQAYGGYAKYLEPLLDSSGWPSTVYNYGIAGDRARWAAIVYDKWCTDTTWIHNGQPATHNQINVALARAPKPEYMLFHFGTNDLGAQSTNSVIEYIKYDIDIILDADVLPVIGTVLPDTRSSHAFKDITGLNSWMRSWVNSNNASYFGNPTDPDLKYIQLAEFYYATSVSNWESMMSDGLHPDNEGRQFMAEIWKTALEEARSVKLEEEEIKKGMIAGALQGPYLLLLLSD